MINMRNKEKMVIVITISLIVIALISAVVILIISVSKENDKNDLDDSDFIVVEEQKGFDKNQKAVQVAIRKFNSYLVDDTKTAADYEKLTGIDEKYFSPTVGPDSVQEYRIDDKYRSQIKENLSSYEAKQKEYATSLAEVINKQFSVKFTDERLYSEDKKEIMQQVQVKTFGYAFYLKDMDGLIEKLLKMANLDTSKENIKSMTDNYKAKVKALEILNSYLSDYYCRETFETNLVYNIGEKISCANCNLYINYTQGYYAREVKVTNEIDYYDKVKEKRIEKLIKKAISDKILDEENPLELN